MTANQRASLTKWFARHHELHRMMETDKSSKLQKEHDDVIGKVERLLSKMWAVTEVEINSIPYAKEMFKK